MDSLASGFASVDSAKDGGAFVRCLGYLHSLPFFQEYKKESLRILGIRPGSRVLEIGCGTGKDLAGIAELSSPRGDAIGIDASITMIARSCSLSRNPDTNYSCIAMDARRLAFREGVFDAVRVDRTLQHIPCPETVIREMARVLCHGGQALAIDPDWETLTIWPGDRAITRTLANFWCDRFRSGWAGRSHYPAFVAAGFTKISVVPLTLILDTLPAAKIVYDLETTIAHAVRENGIESSQGVEWMRDLEEADKKGEFFSSLTFFMVSGMKE